MKLSLNWLNEYVRIKGSPERLAERLTMAGLEVKKLEPVGRDFIFETEITSNRPDWLSHLGVAREIHAVTGAPFSIPSVRPSTQPKGAQKIKIFLPDPDLCPYYSAALLEGVVWAKTPDFMKERLEACGIRSINLIVDITNYVLLEWGQPLHAFDRDRLSGDEISARRARPGEKITAIDGTVYDLHPNDLVIADSRGPAAIGGVMGGKDSEVNERTKNILLESAFFNPVSVRAASRRLGLTSESSYRFERRVDPGGVDPARNRAVELIQKYASVEQAGLAFHSGRLPVRNVRVSVSKPEIKQVLGVEIPLAKAKTFLIRLGLRVSQKGTRMTAVIPSFRSDLGQPADLIEEIARLHGYERIPETLPEMTPLAPERDPLLDLEERARGLCASLGLNEAVTYSLTEQAPLERIGAESSRWVRLNNPQNKELNLMRPTLLSGLAGVVRRNLFAGEKDIRLFEIGYRYFSQSDSLPQEELTLGIALSGESPAHWSNKSRPADFYGLKGIVEELLARFGVNDACVRPVQNPLFRAGESVSVSLEDKELGRYGTLSEPARKSFDLEAPVFFAELSLEQILSASQLVRSVRELPKYPPSPRDLTLILPEAVKAGVVTDRIRELAKDLAQDVQVFDYFTGEKIPKGKKSLSFRIFYQAKDRTLQNEEVNRLHFSIVEALSRQFEAELPKA